MSITTYPPTRSNGNGHKRQRRRRQFTPTGKRRAVESAFLAAKAFMAGLVGTLAEAAVGSNLTYVRAAHTLLKYGELYPEDGEWLIYDVTYGEAPFLATAAQVEPAVKVIEATKKASPENLKAIQVATGLTANLTDRIRQSTVEEWVAAIRDFGGAESFAESFFDTKISPALDAAKPAMPVVVTSAK